MIVTATVTATTIAIVTVTLTGAEIGRRINDMTITIAAQLEITEIIEKEKDVGRVTGTMTDNGHQPDADGIGVVIVTEIIGGDLIPVMAVAIAGGALQIPTLAVAATKA